MSELLWPSLFNASDCIEDAWDERRRLRVRRFGGANPGTVIETRIELRVGDRVRHPKAPGKDALHWYECTPLLCARCDRPSTYGHRDGDLLGCCPCPRCGEHRYVTTAYEVSLDEASVRRKRLHKRLSHVVDQGVDPRTGQRFFTFQLEDECGGLDERVLRLGPGSLIPSGQGDVDYDTPRCTRCGGIRSGSRPIGDQERCPSCGNNAWVIREYRADIIPLSEDEAKLPVPPTQDRSGQTGYGCVWTLLLAALGLGLYFWMGR